MWARLKRTLACARAGSARHGRFGFVSWHVADEKNTAILPQRLRGERSRYYLGRARRLRDAGHYEAAVREARQALALTPAHPWALAVLGQCLLRQQSPDLAAARRATEQAWALEPTNGYFVRLLLEVLDAQGDIVARAELLDWAWWKGAPVERWLPDGPLTRSAADRDDAASPRTPNATTATGRSRAESVRAAVPA